jgi:hypothetical protein
MATSALTMQLLAWIAARPRSYQDTMEAWRTTCPRLTIWEDAVGDGLVFVESAEEGCPRPPNGERAGAASGYPRAGLVVSFPGSGSPATLGTFRSWRSSLVDNDVCQPFLDGLLITRTDHRQPWRSPRSHERNDCKQGVN